jgi:hypothetical protein
MMRVRRRPPQRRGRPRAVAIRCGIRCALQPVVWAGISLCDVCSCHEISRARSGVGAGGQPPPPSALLKRLLEEVQEKTDIVRRCGVESLELRRQQAQLAAHNQVTTIQ